jgi:hypothetical protein
MNAVNLNQSRFSAPRNSLGRFASGVPSESIGPVGPSSSSAPSMVSGWMGILLVLVILVALFAVYYNTIGYYINLGWKKLSWSRERGETVEIDVPGGAHAELVPSPSFDSGIMGRIESDVEAALGDLGSNQVFNVNRNVYTFSDAEPLCRAFGAELATYDQVKDAYKAGADWCNYGWVKGQLAVYPTQKSTYEKLQHGPEEERASCGLPGVNGGYFPNAEQRFGVNCYGKRPAESALDERVQMEANSSIAYDREVNRFKAELDSISVNPWNSKGWSA